MVEPLRFPSNGLEYVVSPGDRLYPFIISMLAAYDVTVMGIELFVNRRIQFPSVIQLSMWRFDAWMKTTGLESLRIGLGMKAAEPLHFYVNNELPLITKDNDEIADKKKTSLNGAQSIVISPFTAQFVIYYERFWQDVAKSVSFNYKKIPTPWDFARIVRNEISHGVVNINDQNAPDVAWYDLVVGPKQNGINLIGPEISCGDMIVLLFEMDCALEAILS